MIIKILKLVYPSLNHLLSNLPSKLFGGVTSAYVNLATGLLLHWLRTLANDVRDTVKQSYKQSEGFVIIAML